MGFTEHNRGRTRKSYDGIYYDGRYLTLSKECQEYDLVKIYTDRDANLIKLEHSDDCKDFKVSKHRRISAPGLPMPKGRYIYKQVSTDVNGGVYELKAVKEVE